MFSKSCAAEVLYVGNDSCLDMLYATTITAQMYLHYITAFFNHFIYGSVLLTVRSNTGERLYNTGSNIHSGVRIIVLSVIAFQPADAF